MADYTFPTSYGVGTATISNGSMTVTGQGTYWMSDDPKLSPLRAGDLFGTHVGIAVRISDIVSDTELTLAHEWPGDDQTAAPYEIQLTPRIVGAQEATRRLLVSLANGNIEAFAALAGGSDLLPIFTGSGTMGTINRSDLINGVRYDVQVDDLAGRAAYDGQEEGFAVLVADIGDSRSALYTKRSNTSADWSDPAYITGATGEEGPFTTIIFAPVQTLPPGDNVTMTTDTSVPGQVTITLGVPVGVPGDMAGPDGGVADGDYVVFDGTSGKLVKKASSAPGGQNDALFAIEIADLKGVRLGMVGGVADAFDDEAGVAVGSSVNQVYDAANDLYRPASSATTQDIGTAAAALPYSAGTFIDWGNPLTANDVISGVGLFGSAATYSVKILRRNSAGNYDVIVSESFSHPGGGYAVKDLATPFVVPATGLYCIGVYLPAITTNNRTAGTSRAYNSGNVTGSGVTASENLANADLPPFRVLKNPVVSDMTLVSVSYSASVQPSSGRVSIQLAGTEIISPNVDLFGDISRDNGTTWTAAVLALTTNLSGIRMYEANDISLSSQPAGSSVKWRVRTANNKNIQVSGVVLQWKD
ncbi:hypothetical protein [Agrobacterium sp.]|uniref:hypothetical protein n=1 Tax=Agrobacterium sp. TaxID=361 RepID=UPI0028AD41F4|nr:hypothetical protein [Agrobacterium sp.]